MSDATVPGAPVADEPEPPVEPATQDALDAQDPQVATASPGAEPPGAYATFAVLEVRSVHFHLPSPSPVVQLREGDAPFRQLHFPIGLPEAQAIAMALERERGARPSTAELLADALAAAGVDVVAVRLTGTREGTMLGELDLMGPRGRVTVDCRPSDGIAVALRQPVPAPILCDVALLDE